MDIYETLETLIISMGLVEDSYVVRCLYISNTVFELSAD